MEDPKTREDIVLFFRLLENETLKFFEKLRIRYILIYYTEIYFN